MHIHSMSNTKLKKSFIEHVSNQFELNLNGIHGIEHWARVRLNGILLSRLTGADVVVVVHFAFLHDARRLNDGDDPEHGPRAAVFAGSLLGTHLFLDDKQMMQLTTACKGHTSELFSDDITVATCWDADRLDLGRVGIVPDPLRLSTDEARNPEFIQDAYQRSSRIVQRANR